MKNPTLTEEEEKIFIQELWTQVNRHIQSSSYHTNLLFNFKTVTVTKNFTSSEKEEKEYSFKRYGPRLDTFNHHPN